MPAPAVPRRLLTWQWNKYYGNERSSSTMSDVQAAQWKTGNLVVVGDLCWIKRYEVWVAGKCKRLMSGANVRDNICNWVKIARWMLWSIQKFITPTMLSPRDQGNEFFTWSLREIPADLYVGAHLMTDEGETRKSYRRLAPIPAEESGNRTDRRQHWTICHQWQSWGKENLTRKEPFAAAMRRNALRQVTIMVSPASRLQILYH